MTALQLVALVLLIDAAGPDPGVLAGGAGGAAPDRRDDAPRVDARAVDAGRDARDTDAVNERAIAAGRDDRSTPAVDERAAHRGRDSYATDAVNERAIHRRRDDGSTPWLEHDDDGR